MRVPAVGEAQGIMSVRDDMDRIARWCGGEAELYEAGVTVPTLQGPKLAKPREWIVKTGGAFEILEAKLGNLLYRAGDPEVIM